MQDEELDNIIREAAEHHHPSYDDRAWDKMKLLLDKHLPQDKNRKRPFWIFLLFTLLVAGGGYYLIHQFKGGKNNSAETNKSQPLTATPKQTNENNNANNQAAPATNNVATNLTTNPVTTNSVITHPVSPTDKNSSQQPVGNTNNTNNGQQMTTVSSNNSHTSGLTGKFVSGKTKSKTKINVNAPDVTVNPTDQGDVTVTEVLQPDSRLPAKIVKKDPLIAYVPTKTSVTITESEPLQKDKPWFESPPKMDDKKENKENKDKKDEPKKKEKHSIAGNFGITLSAGPDISAVETKRPGKVEIAYGASLGYTFLKRITVQAGFFIVRKIYSADSADYKVPDAILQTYPFWDNIDANCKVYEIPINVLYSFGQRKKHNWVAGAGISSYIMRSEAYNYSYKFNGQTISQDYAVENQNQHNFSVVGLTAGYQYNISNRVSVSAQPYIKVPLTGIGVGKVQLKSGGVMFNATVRPFAKRH